MGPRNAHKRQKLRCDANFLNCGRGADPPALDECVAALDAGIERLDCMHRESPGLLVESLGMPSSHRLSAPFGWKFHSVGATTT